MRTDDIDHQERDSLSEEQQSLLKYYNEEVTIESKNSRSLGERSVRHIVRTHIWSNTKFLIGEGSERRTRNYVPEFGNSHERPDLTKPKEEIGYPIVVIRYAGLDTDNNTMEQRAKYWKQWEAIVRHEVQVKRANVMKKVKDTLTESKWKKRN